MGGRAVLQKGSTLIPSFFDRHKADYMYRPAKYLNAALPPQSGASKIKVRTLGLLQLYVPSPGLLCAIPWATVQSSTVVCPI